MEQFAKLSNLFMKSNIIRGLKSRDTGPLTSGPR